MKITLKDLAQKIPDLMQALKKYIQDFTQIAIWNAPEDLNLEGGENNVSLQIIVMGKNEAHLAIIKKIFSDFMLSADIKKCSELNSIYRDLVFNENHIKFSNFIEKSTKEITNLITQLFDSDMEKLNFTIHTPEEDEESDNEKLEQANDNQKTFEGSLHTVFKQKLNDRIMSDSERLNKKSKISTVNIGQSPYC